MDCTEKRLTVADVMNLYNISRETALTFFFRAKGTGAFKFGRKWYIRESDLLRLETKWQKG